MPGFSSHVAYPNFDVVVMDNGSTDNSLTHLRNYTAAYPLTLLETGGNLGYAGGNNVGTHHAMEHGAEFILLLNNDTSVAPDLLERLFEAVQRTPDTGVFDVDKKFDEIVDFAEMSEFIDTPVKRYSSGMQVKLAFAVATSIEAEILFVDEVLAVSDLAFQRKCFDRMEDVIRRQGRTVLLVSHNIRQVERMCARVIVSQALFIYLAD